MGPVTLAAFCMERVPGSHATWAISGSSHTRLLQNQEQVCGQVDLKITARLAGKPGICPDAHGRSCWKRPKVLCKNTRWERKDGGKSIFQAQHSQKNVPRAARPADAVCSQTFQLWRLLRQHRQGIIYPNGAAHVCLHYSEKELAIFQL